MFLERLPNQDSWHTFGRMQDLQERLKRLSALEQSYYGSSQQFPPLQAWLSDSGAILKFELPGVSESKVDITVTGNSLTLTGKKEKEPLAESDKPHRRELNYGSFTRTIQLPFQVDAEKVKADFSRGILKIELPRAEADKPRKITVKSGG